MAQELLTSVEEYGEICLKKYKRLYKDMNVLDREINENMQTVESTVRMMITVAAKDKGDAPELVQNKDFQQNVMRHFVKLVKEKTQ
ncbi:MAG: hypothetical protein ACK4NC_06770 [Candidatus Gracilibacteria bacterium]